MPVFLCQIRDSLCCGVMSGENAADAVLKYDRIWIGDDKQDEYIDCECDGSINTYCEKLLMEYEVTEIYRAMVMEYVERRLDGDINIIILL